MIVDREKSLLGESQTQRAAALGATVALDDQTERRRRRSLNEIARSDH